MKNLPLQIDPLPIRVDHASNGALRIGPTRVTLDVMLEAYRGGASPEEIVSRFPTLNLADVYSVVGHYLRHREKFDVYLNECDREFERLRAEALANGQAELVERLRGRMAARHGTDAALPR